MRFDAHQHFWRYTPEEYAWITEPLGALRRDFLPGDLRPLLDRHGLDGCVAVQARQTLEETRWLLELAREHPWIVGVVGWIDLCADDAGVQLERLAEDPRLVGLRHIAQDEPDDEFLLRPDFVRGVSLLEPRGLVYDLLVYPRQLPAAIGLARRLPEQAFVLDHLAKPPARERRTQPWAQQLAELARLPNVYCKLSGLVTEADWERWSPRDVTPYLDLALDAFGVERTMFGSDWPVCTLASSYERWYEVFDGWAWMLSPTERAALLGGTAARVYRLEHRPA
jgi:L-fuconolactonase